MIQVDLVVSFLSYTPVYNLELAKKYLLYFIFSSRFLYLSLNRCDAKLKQFWVIDVLLLHWVLVSCIFLSISFSCCFRYFSLVIDLSLLKKWWKVLFRDFHQVNLKSLSHNLSSNEWCRESTLAHGLHCLTFTLVSVFWNSAENSPCKVNVFTKRYAALVKEWEYIHDAFLFTTLKKLSHIVTQLISFSYILIFWYVVNKCTLLCSICFVFRSLLVN